jgi:hypothetical protein
VSVVFGMIRPKEIMDETVRATIYAALIGVGGILIGIILSFCLESLRTWYRENNTKRRVRELLRLEIDHNLKELNEFWGEMRQVEPSKIITDFQILPEVLKLTGIPLLMWSHNIWQSQLSLLHVALKDDEAKETHFIHRKLDEITNLHNKILVTYAEFKQPEPTSNNPLGVSFHKTAFYHNSAQLFQQMKIIVSKLQARGNPLS